MPKIPLTQTDSAHDLLTCIEGLNKQFKETVKQYEKTHTDFQYPSDVYGLLASQNMLQMSKAISGIESSLTYLSSMSQTYFDNIIKSLDNG